MFAVMFDSTLIAALLLLGAALFAARPGTGNYLRFAAILCAALATCLLGHLPELAAATALVALPLAGAGLALSGLARARRKVPPLFATVALAASLFAGLFAFFTATVSAALLPLAFGGVAMLFSRRLFTMLPGFLLLAAACAGLSAGLTAPLLCLLAGALAGAGLHRRASKAHAATLASAAP